MIKNKWVLYNSDETCLEDAINHENNYLFSLLQWHRYLMINIFFYFYQIKKKRRKSLFGYIMNCVMLTQKRKQLINLPYWKFVVLPKANEEQITSLWDKKHICARINLLMEDMICFGLLPINHDMVYDRTSGGGKHYFQMCVCYFIFFGMPI